MKHYYYPFCLTAEELISSARDKKNRDTEEKCKHRGSNHYINYHLANKMITDQFSFNHNDKISIKQSCFFTSFPPSVIKMYTFSERLVSAVTADLPPSAIFRAARLVFFFLFPPPFLRIRWKKKKGVNQATSHRRPKRCPPPSPRSEHNP